MSTTKIGVIGGSGIYDIDGLQNPKWQQVESPSAVPSDQLLTAQLARTHIVSLPPHRRGHVPPTHLVPHPATIAPFNCLRVKHLGSTSPSGAVREQLEQ